VSAHPTLRRDWEVQDYALGETLESGQAFGWDRDGDGWTGVVSGRWVRLSQCGAVISAEVAEPLTDWGWIESYLDLHEDLASVLATFPQDVPLGEAIAACRGLRLLRQEPWECLAGFICSSTKQIVQIRQIVRNLRERYGAPVVTPEGVSSAFAFPTVEVVAALDESALRACKLGFRAPYLLGAARRVIEGKLDLAVVSRVSLEEARAQLMELSGVGRKVADCALLFGFGHRQAFPVDVWVRVALTRLYFPRARKVTARRIEEFSASYFGVNGGYAQQYLFHYVRTRLGRAWAAGKVDTTGASPAPVKAARVRRP
jgi:N-glycosylase/DNA lyase